MSGYLFTAGADIRAGEIVTVDPATGLLVPAPAYVDPEASECGHLTRQDWCPGRCRLVSLPVLGEEPAAWRSVPGDAGL